MSPAHMPSKIRKRIVVNAVQCFATHGYSGCSTKEIAARADVTEGSLFRVCISKDKLFGEALGLALTSKKVRRSHLRLIAFAMLEGRGLDEPNRKALKRLVPRCPLIKALRAIEKRQNFTMP
jgi:AcrR family transcriptional regulator